MHHDALCDEGITECGDGGGGCDTRVELTAVCGKTSHLQEGRERRIERYESRKGKRKAKAKSEKKGKRKERGREVEGKGKAQDRKD